MADVVKPSYPGTAGLADELTKWVERYALKVCPPGCLPLPAQEREINMFARIALALRDPAQGTYTETAAGLLRELYEWCRGCNDFRLDSNLARRVQSALRVPAQGSLHCGKSWTPDQFWEYVEGLTDTFVRDQMRNTLAERGLVLTSTGGGTAA